MWTTFGWNLGSVSAGIVIAILTGFYISHRSKPTVGLPLGVITGLAVFAVIQAAANTLSTVSTTNSTPTGEPTPPTTQTTPTPTPTPNTPTPTITDPATSTDATDPTPPSPSSKAPTPPSTQTYFLADVPYTHVEKEGRAGTCDGGCTGFHGDSARIGGNTYPNSWVMEIDGDGRRGTTTWNTLGACTQLDTNVGLTDDSPDTQVTFTATTDQGTERSTTATIGDAQPLRLNLTGARTLTIAAYVTGNEVERPDVAWGNLRITCRTGSIQTSDG